MIESQKAQRFIDSSTFLWHQRFELGPGIITPGVSDVGFLANVSRLPEDLTGLSVLDVGTTNGGTAFLAEARGAARVVAIDIAPPEMFGILQLIDVLQSAVEFRQSSIYELGTTFAADEFDVVVCWGVLYHLRHPLLALDALRSVSRDLLLLETAACPNADQPVLQFFRKSELGADPTNWFAPTPAALAEMVESCGFCVEHLEAWPASHVERAAVAARTTPGPPEWQMLSYEQPLHVRPMA